MPAGHTHTVINVAALAATGAVAYGLHDTAYAVTPHAFGLYAAAFLAGTFLITPDLDLANQHVDAKRNWGPLGILWVPYGLLSKHRGSSHSFVIGPLVRLIYLAILLGAAAYITRALIPDAHAWLSGLALPTQPAFYLPLAAGYLLSQWLHLFADGIYPWSR